MPTLSKIDAVETLARGVEQARPSNLVEIQAELFPQTISVERPDVSLLVQHIRSELEAEEIVDLWNVVFPEDRHVWYDEEAEAIRFNEEMAAQSD